MSVYETPSCKCPYCGEECEAEWVDIGVGMQQVSPYICTFCHAVEAGPFDDELERADQKTGWYKPTTTQENEI